MPYQCVSSLLLFQYFFFFSPFLYLHFSSYSARGDQSAGRPHVARSQLSEREKRRAVELAARFRRAQEAQQRAEGAAGGSQPGAHGVAGRSEQAAVASGALPRAGPPGNARVPAGAAAGAPRRRGGRSSRAGGADRGQGRGGRVRQSLGRDFSGGGYFGLVEQVHRGGPLHQSPGSEHSIEPQRRRRGKAICNPLFLKKIVAFTLSLHLRLSFFLPRSASPSFALIRSSYP